MVAYGSDLIKENPLAIDNVQSAMDNTQCAIHLESGVLANHKREKTRQAGEPERGERERVDLSLGLVHRVLVHGKTLYKLFIRSLMGWILDMANNAKP